MEYGNDWRKKMSRASTSFVTEQFQEAYPDGIENHYWNLGRNHIIASLLRDLPKGNILEIGAGRGIVIQYLRKIGFQAWGSELSPVKLISEDIKDYLYPNQNAFQLDEKFRTSVETLLLLDMLEHLENPKDFLTECIEKFPNAKNILITLPARQELWSNYDENYGHYRRYDLRTANSLCSSLGTNWKAKTSSYFFHLLYPLARILLAISSKRETAIKAPTGIFSFLHRFLGLYFSFETALLPKSLPGTSLYILFSKD